MLLIHNHQAHIRELHRILNQRVCTDEQVDLPALQGRQQLRPLFLGRASCQQLHAHIRTLEQVLQGGQMLVSQDFRGRHDTGLIAVIDHQQRYHQRHKGLT